MRFDVPVIGLSTVEVMKRYRVTALAVDAHRTLLLDRVQMMNAADAAGIAIQAFEPASKSQTEPGASASAAPSKKK
jgi:DUF1009 family protein